MSSSPLESPTGELIVFRHGQSMANVAFAEAEANDSDLVDLACRDSDAALSPKGREQSRELAKWMTAHSLFPQRIYCSPYLRARETFSIIQQNLGSSLKTELSLDERIRDKELGSLAKRTPASVERNFPDEVLRLREIGDFYYRPPGGESFADVALRVRSLLCELSYASRTLFITHEPVVAMLRYVLESVPDSDVNTLIPVSNASVSRWALFRDRSVYPIEYNNPERL